MAKGLKAGDRERDPEAYLAECVKIDDTVITEEYIRLPSDMAYWNARYADCFRFWLQAKVQRDLTEARLSAEWREQLEAKAKGGRITLGEIENAVFQDPQYIDAKAKEVMAEAEKVRLYGIMEALRAKREMLVSLGAHLRMEMDHDPMLRKQAYIDREKERNR
jgi:hypothetical protein